MPSGWRGGSCATQVPATLEPTMGPTQLKLDDLVTAKLASSGLTAEHARELGMEVVESARSLDKTWPDVPALKLNYHDVAGEPLRNMFRVRLLVQPRGSFGQVSDTRYLQPTNTTPAAYLPATLDWEAIAADPDVQILITEGELKAACASVHDHACIGLGGVWSWRSKKLGWGLIPELSDIVWAGRDVVIVYDSDARTNPQVALATSQLMAALSRLGACPRVAQLPDLPETKKVGLDDFVVACGPDAFAQVLKEAEGDELTQKLWGYNARFAFILDPGIVYDEQKRNVYEPGKFRSVTFANDVANIKTISTKGDVKIKPVPVADSWIKWPARRQLDRITYLPGEPATAGDDLNVWPGWGCEASPGSVDLWQDLLGYLIDDEEARAWLEAWCLYPLANPGAKQLSAVLLWSYRQGVGKTLLGETLGAVYGDNWALINQSQLEGSFNEWLPRRQFIMVDDMSSYQSRSNADIFKSLVTQTKVLINEKFVPQYTLPAVVNYYCTSNQPNAIYLEPDDRRWFVYEIQREPRPAQWYKDFHAWLGSGGAAALLHHAREFDFSNFDPYARPPTTPAKQAMMKVGRNESEEWIAQLVDNPDSILTAGGQATSTDAWTAADLLEIFNLTRKGRPITASLLSARLGQFFPAVEVDGATMFVIYNRDKWLADRGGLAKHLAANRGTREKKY